MTDWFRRKSWTTTDEKEFFAKLNRARADSRAQYLKIQAIEFVATNDKSLLVVAELLLNKVLTEYPDNNFERSPVLHTLGDIYKIRLDYGKALDFYKQSLDFETKYPGVTTNSYLDFSELVVKTTSVKSFDFVKTLLHKKLQEFNFPIAKYKMCSILSIIYKSGNDSEKSGYFAGLARQNANAETSGLPYHKDLGIVTKHDDWLDNLVNS